MKWKKYQLSAFAREIQVDAYYFVPLQLNCLMSMMVCNLYPLFS